MTDAIIRPGFLKKEPGTVPIFVSTKMGLSPLGLPFSIKLFSRIFQMTQTLHMPLTVGDCPDSRATKMGLSPLGRPRWKRQNFPVG